MNAVASTRPIPGRDCGDCAMCCHLGEIVGFKPYNQWCVSCSTHQRCDRYETRPALCRQFECHYLLSDLGEEWRPNHCGLIVSFHANPNRISILVDPEQPLRWREMPYIAQIMRWAQAYAVTVMVEAEAFAVYPDRIEALGAIAEDETIVTQEQVLASGAVRFVSKRMKKAEVAAFLAAQGGVAG